MKTLVSIAVFLLFCTIALAQTTTRVSVASDGTEGDDDTYAEDIDWQGRFVALESHATNLVTDDTNEEKDCFVHDRSTGETTRVSVAGGGSQANNACADPRLSADGRYVSFYSGATNLVLGDTNDVHDVFVRDRSTAKTYLVSVASDGTLGDGHSSHPSITTDGQIVSFKSGATNLVAGDTNFFADVFVHDRTTGETVRVSLASDGTQANDDSRYSSLNANGQLVVFDSGATNLVTPDANDWMNDVFVHDRHTGETSRISVASDGTQGNGVSMLPDISPDGWLTCFRSTSNNLVAGDTNGTWDVFVHDRQLGETIRVSVSSSGLQGNGSSSDCGLSPDGRYVGFESAASNLVAGDTNGVKDIFVRDLLTGETRRVSVSSDGDQGDAQSAVLLTPTPLSWGAQSVAFYSDATNLVAGDTNSCRDAFVVELGLFSDGFESGDFGDWIVFPSPAP